MAKEDSRSTILPLGNDFWFALFITTNTPARVSSSPTAQLLSKTPSVHRDYLHILLLKLPILIVPVIFGKFP